KSHSNSNANILQSKANFVYSFLWSQPYLYRIKNNMMNAENIERCTNIAFKWKLLFFCLSVFCLLSCSRTTKLTMEFKETQLTTTTNGHTIHNTQVFSKDDNWIVYDTRNDDTMIGSTGSIEMVNVETGE